MLMDSDCFNIRGIDVRFYGEANSLKHIPLGNISDNNVIGTSIFLVDLRRLKDEIELQHPEFKDIVIRRALPNRLVVQAKKRLPLAQIRADRVYLLDEEGVFLTDIKNFAADTTPMILGIDIKASRLARPKLNPSQQQKADKALSLVTALSVNKKLARYRLKRIDVTDSRNISFFLDMANVELKIGDFDFANRLNMLATVLEQLDEDIDRVKYIDLRFEDPIVGPR
jgi:cell division septal protein FtsQ